MSISPLKVLKMFNGAWGSVPAQQQGEQKELERFNIDPNKFSSPFWGFTLKTFWLSLLTLHLAANVAYPGDFNVLPFCSAFRTANDCNVPLSPFYIFLGSCPPHRQTAPLQCMHPNSHHLCSLILTWVRQTENVGNEGVWNAEISEIATEFQLSGSLLSKHFGGAESWQLLTRYPEKTVSTNIADPLGCWKIINISSPNAPHSATRWRVTRVSASVPFMTCSFCAPCASGWCSPVVHRQFVPQWNSWCSVCSIQETFYIDSFPILIDSIHNCVLSHKRLLLCFPCLWVWDCQSF